MPCGEHDDYEMAALAAGAVGVCMSLPATADAKVPCRNQVFNDWEHDGQIASTYPLACYRDALRHVPTTEQIYTSLRTTFAQPCRPRSPRQHGEKVADQIGHKFTSTTPDSPPTLVDRRSMHDEQVNPTNPGEVTNASGPLAGSTSGGGIPTPLLVLGGIALVLVGSGAVGMIAPSPPRRLALSGTSRRSRARSAGR